MSLHDHPTVRRVRTQPRPAGQKVLDATWLRRLCREAGADDVGFVEIDRAELADQRNDIRSFFRPTRALISFVCRMNREPIRSPARSVANLEFQATGDRVNEVAQRIVAALEQANVRAVNPAMGFPMEMDRFPGKIWVVSHKPVAVAAGLGRIGIHRNVIHPRFGNFILLGTVLIDREISEYSQALEYNPCLECKLCVAACPVGAISADGYFNFSACYTHNYREFMGGFTNWAEQLADSSSGRAYRQRVSDAESASMWQSLAFGPNYKAAYCLAVCPAGEEVIGPYLADQHEHLRAVVRPLQKKPEPVYVVPGSDAELHVARRFPHKTAKRVGRGIRPRSIPQFLAGLKLNFQREQSAGLHAVFHFTFTGQESCQATITIQNKLIEVQDGLRGTCQLHVIADSQSWLGFVAKERSLAWALLTRKIRLHGPPKLLKAFGKCF